MFHHCLVGPLGSAALLHRPLDAQIPLISPSRRQKKLQDDSPVLSRRGGGTVNGRASFPSPAHLWELCRSSRQLFHSDIMAPATKYNWRDGCSGLENLPTQPGLEFRILCLRHNLTLKAHTHSGLLSFLGWLGNPLPVIVFFDDHFDAYPRENRTQTVPLSEKTIRDPNQCGRHNQFSHRKKSAEDKCMFRP